VQDIKLMVFDALKENEKALLKRGKKNFVQIELVK
jgi:hypothetical protein